MIPLHIKKLRPEAKLPTYATDGAACFDLYADFSDKHINVQAYGVEITPARPATISTGLAVEIPEGHVMLVFSRSGHGFKSNVRLANCVGVIDSDYRGAVQVKLTNDAGGPFRVQHGDRIAQAMVVPCPRINLVEVDELSTTERGDGGFGSTGK